MSAERTPHGRWIGAAVGGLLLTGVVVGACGYTAATVDDADRDAGAPLWASPEGTADVKTPAAEATGLAGALVPYRPDGWTRGPDLGEFGADVSLSGARATALSKESLSGLPRSQRKEMEKEIDRRHITGVAMRSYASTGGYHDNEQTGAVSLTVVLTRMKDTAVRSGASDQDAFLESLDVFEAGPRVKGHKDARCHRLPADSDDGLDIMFCNAYRGDVLVSVTAEGVQPFGGRSVAALLAEQLDRIAEPGRSV
ncbi:hypothetical protein ACF1HU_34670 [Streptomyces olivaceus]|uniref:hypothetical protein n=1 Tax=Streptomyces olivaceus TaxID=47716 RepID=UPI0004CA12EC|nr:hypothetical protein [Streptomyces olivaceus]MBZ6083548.1 hypothetical protein [Streptomyces olivaceus]MBZ6105800.1 hypothetical protein [Streptomyces olivaceus]